MANFRLTSISIAEYRTLQDAYLFMILKNASKRTALTGTILVKGGCEPQNKNAKVLFGGPDINGKTVERNTLKA